MKKYQKRKKKMRNKREKRRERGFLNKDYLDWWKNNRLK